MSGILIFGGTSEGRREALRLKAQGKTVSVCVTTAYARRLLPGDMDCRVGALDRAGMLHLMNELRPELAIDATHPFAVKATETIRACCEETGTKYLRIEREPGAHLWRDDVEHVCDSASAARALAQTQGNALLTTGSHTLPDYTAQVAPSRLWARVLPTMDALTRCEKAGIEPSHIIAMQGPFSAELNAALYDQLHISAMVSKDSGPAGGVDEKVLPALARGIHVIMIDRPGEA